MNPVVLSSQSNYLVTFLASFLIWFLFLGLFILWLVDGKIKKEVVLHAVLASMVSWVISLGLKSLLPFPRPFMINNLPPLTLTTPTSLTSFPSAHSTVAFAIATSVWLHNKKWGLFFITGACLVGLGRVASNVHFFVDVIGGALIGISASYIIKKLHPFKLLS
ncbi:MAG: bacitracin transport permease BCRC [Candidatus Woesebacteria bacterium GW2011_GWA1_37_7]|uniref:Bacitracin transport permease BCRC n=2 Tax=Candidatus Woeseibacteriota TaxID=1752722 RepID=A0A0G0K8T8_9BACT|nr:MAG: bacitracin transport permease BCRC [Candidatus Woesebacteria bacterium GW2011_GWA1_37_7]OGM19522.1 MAG: hypothetical protein A2685_00255 [Candidatus Woesebacteria bacterium RIFCSPHIGHO2_01_FULL_37_10]